MMKWLVRVYACRPSWKPLVGILMGVPGVVVLFSVLSSPFHEEPIRPANNQSIAFDPPTFDFGTVLQAETVRHEFSLVNRGTNEMLVVGFHTTCSCAVVKDKLLGKAIPSQGAILVPVEFESGTRDGQVSASVTIYLLARATNADRVLHAALAVIRGEVLSEFTMEPASLDFGTVKPGEQATQTVVFHPKHAKNLSITAVRSTHKAFEVSLQERGGSPAQAFPRATITFHAPLASRCEPISDLIHFTTSCERVSNATLYVRAEVRPEIEVSPPAIILPSDSATGENRMTIRTESPSRILRVVKKTSQGDSELHFIEDSEEISGGWGKSHCWSVSNAQLASAHRIDVELEVRNGSDRTEARFASVPIRSLKQANSK